MPSAFIKFNGLFPWALICLCVCSHTCFAAGALTLKQGDPDRPNVLFIAVDDLNDWADILGGHPGVQTPNINRLAGQGVCFTRAYCSAPACNPSRTSLLFGRRPSSTGVYYNGQPWTLELKEAVTLPRHFKNHGYETVGAGKIFHSLRASDSEAWDFYENRSYIFRKGISADVFQAGMNRDWFDWGPLKITDDEMPDMKTAGFGVNFLNQDHDRPFFLALGIFRPHLPWCVPEKYFNLYPPDKIALPKIKENDLDDLPQAGRNMALDIGTIREGDHEAILSSNNWHNAVAAYMASITFADACVGKILDALEKSKYADNTIIVLWGDHGWNLGEKQHWRKFALWEDTTRVPLIISIPGTAAKGAHCERVVSLLDLYPTLVKLCGLTEKKELEGRNLIPLLKNPDAAWPYGVVMTQGRNTHAIRTERWRYIRYSDESEELYDHAKDSHEWTNLAEQPQYIKIKAELGQWLPVVNAPNAPPPPQKSDEPEPKESDAPQPRKNNAPAP